jgi:membrane-associated phospholipid phosphatase
MTKRLLVGVLGVALMFVLGTACAATAEELGVGASTSEDDSAGHESSSQSSSQTSEAPGRNPMAKIHNRTSMGLIGRFLKDQEEIWTGPAKMRAEDVNWMLPFAGLSGALFATDSSFHKSQSGAPATIQRYKTISTAGVAALAGGAGGMWLLSFHTRGGLDNEHWRETGFLAGEATLNSLLLVEAMKYSLRRQRPLQGAGGGPFFQSGGTSFPSEHAAAAWSIAGVVAHEYPGPLTKIAAYGLATVVSFSRVQASQHFPSDVLIGGLAGYVISQSIYSRHASPDVPGAEWRSFRKIFELDEDTSLENMGSSYVPLDSWVYPAIERLEAMGYIHTAFEGAKPWAGTECARLIAEASDELSAASAEGSPETLQVEALLAALSNEFHREVELETGGPNRSATLQSTYMRVTSASGVVLTDGYHFGQTYAYDYGRPFRRGTNFISGFSTDFTSGPVFLHLSGEFQHAPGAPALSDALREVISERDLVPISPAQVFLAINRLAMMDSYAGFNLDNLQISFGKQSLSWGPGPGGSLILSDNADPFYMVRVAQVQPIELPSFLGVLGPMRFESFMGREKGHPISGHPFIYGQKVSLKPFPSLEFAYSRTTTIGGSTDPVNTRLFFQSFFGRVDAKEGSVPGDSHTSIDWTWQIPHLHNRLVLYGEMESDDDPIPLQNPTRAVLRPGIFIVQLPWLNKWDLHGEWTSSVCPGEVQDQGHLNYFNTNYRDGYTNNGNLVGNTVGREGKTIQAWTRYWISPRQTVEFTAKNSEVDTDFIPGGGKWQDYRVTHEVALRSGIFFRSFVQFEHIAQFPVLFSGARDNLTVSLEIGFGRGLRY